MWLDLDTIRAEEFWVFVRPVERPLPQCIAGDFATLCWRLTVGLWEAAELWLSTAETQPRMLCGSVGSCLKDNPAFPANLSMLAKPSEF